MASAAITIISQPATIESDTSEAVITKNTDLYHMEGELRNHGPADVWCIVSVTTTAAVNVVTTGAQAQRQVPLPAGGVLPWMEHYYSLAHKTAAGTATLSWVPSSNLNRR